MSAFNLVPSKYEISNMSMKDLHYANYTDENVLFKMNPQQGKLWEDLTDGVIEYVASASPNIYANEGSLMKYFSSRNAVRMVDNEWVRWSLKGTGKIKCLSMENLMPNNPTPGIGGSEILLKVNHNTWVPSDTVYPECAPTVEFTVQSDAIPDGTGYIFTLQLKSLSDFHYVDSELLDEGLTWCKRGATHSEASNQYGSSYVPGGPSLIQFQSHIGSYSKSHEVTDKGGMHILRMRGKKKMGNGYKYMHHKHDYVVHFEEAEFMAQVRYEREQDLFWGRDAGYRIKDGSTGLYRRTGPGLLEFYEDGNMVPYSTENFTVDFLKEIFTTFFYGRVTPNKANIVVRCGIGLMMLVDKALNDEYAKRPIQRTREEYARAGRNFPGSNKKGLTLTSPQIFGFDLNPYGTIRFEHFALLDDVEMNGAWVHPETQMPITSYWGFIDDIGIGLNNNVEILRLRNSEFMTYTCGVYSPVGYINGRNDSGFTPAHSRRSYKVLYSINEGVRVKDTKRTLFLHPDFE